MKGTGAGVHRHAVLHLAIRAELALELGDLRAEDEGRVLAHPIQRGEELVPDVAVLRLQIEVGHVHGGASQWRMRSVRSTSGRSSDQ